jgi:hypothetical protein
MKALISALALGMQAASALSAQAPQWSVSSRPVVQIGAVEGDPADLLDQVTGVVRLLDGRVVVADRSGIRYYDSRGRFQVRASRHGNGPEEYGIVAQLVRLPGDSILIWDAVRRARLWFNSRGQFVRREPVVAQFNDYRVMSFEFSSVLPNGMVLSRPFPQFDERTGQVDRHPRLFVLADPGTGSRVELGTYGGTAGLVVSTAPRPEHAWQPFSPDTHFALAQDRIYIGDSARPHIDVFRLDGSRADSVLLRREQARVESRHLRLLHEQLMARIRPELRPAAERNWANAPKPDRFPYFRDLFVDAEDCLWVMDFPADAQGPSSWTVFDRTGRELARVELPARLKVMDIGDEYVAGVWQDTEDVQYVQVWALDRRPASTNRSGSLNASRP